MNDVLKRLYRQIQMLVCVGRTTRMNDQGVAQTLQYQTPLDIRSDTPRIAEFGFTSGVPDGSDVVVLFVGGDRSNGVIIATNHQSYRKTNLAAGETMIYDQWGGYIHLTENGIVVDANNQSVTVNNATNVVINAANGVEMNTPILKVSGDIIDNCGTNSATLKKLRDAYNNHTHPINNIQSGSSTVDSSKTGTIT